jgi:hypothetical protein
VKHNRTVTKEYFVYMKRPWGLEEGVLLEQLKDLVLVVELGDVDGRLPIHVLERAAMRWRRSKKCRRHHSFG